VFLADDDPYPSWPARQVQQAGELGDPGTGPHLPISVVGGFPDPLGPVMIACCMSPVVVVLIE
jgi:hypothetical protein